MGVPAVEQRGGGAEVLARVDARDRAGGDPRALSQGSAELGERGASRALRRAR